MTKAVRFIIGALLVVVGAVWIVQGVGALDGSFMSGDAAWAVIGAVVVILGVAVLVGASRTGRDSWQADD